MDSGGAVAELGGPDVGRVRSVRKEPDLGVGKVAARRDGVDHGQRRSLPGDPVRAQVIQPGGPVPFEPAGQGVLHQPGALVQPVAAVVDVLFRFGMGGEHVVAFEDHVAAAELQRVHPDPGGELVDAGLDGEDHLAQAVAAERPGGNRVGVDRVGVHLLVGALVHAQGFAAAVEHHADGMVAVGAGVGEHVQLQRRQPAVPAGAGLEVDGEGVPGGGGRELLRPGEFELHRPLQLQRRQGDDVLGEHFLLAAEAAAHPAGHHADLLLRQVKDPGQGAPDQERHLAGGADLEPAVVVNGGDGGVRFQRGVLHALGPVGLFVDEIGLGKPGGNTAEFRMQLRHDVPFGPADACGGRVLFAVDRRGARPHRFLGGEDGVQHLVVDLEGAHAGFRRRHGIGDDGGNLLPDEPDHVVQHAGIVRIVGVQLVLGGGEQLCRGVLVGEDGHHAGDFQGRG